MSALISWAGSRSAVVTALHKAVMACPVEVKRFFDPFCGGLDAAIRVNTPSRVLTDNDPDLINYFEVLRDQGPAALLHHMSSHKNDKEYFLLTRHRHNQEIMAAIDERCNFNGQDPEYKAKLAAEFYYLSRFSFRSLLRHNQAGEINSSFGKRKNTPLELYACDMNKIEPLRGFLQGSTIGCEDFTYLTDWLNSGRLTTGDLVYLDAPFVARNAPLSTRFGRARFGQVTQLAIQLAEAGIAVVVSGPVHEAFPAMLPGFFVDKLHCRNGAATAYETLAASFKLPLLLDETA